MNLTDFRLCPVTMPSAALVGALGVARRPGSGDPKDRPHWAIGNLGGLTARSTRLLARAPT